MHSVAPSVANYIEMEIVVNLAKKKNKLLKILIRKCTNPKCGSSNVKSYGILCECLECNETWSSTPGTWKQYPPIQESDLHIGCINCSTATLVADMDMLVSVGFGRAVVEKDGVVIYDDNKVRVSKMVEHFERMAAKDPDHDWRIIKHGPMHGETFQRHGKENWVCIESNKGFA
jgi:hypothetical protein